MPDRRSLKLHTICATNVLNIKNRPNINLGFVKLLLSIITITARAFASFPVLDLFWNCGAKLNILPPSGVLCTLTGTAPEGFLQYDITHQCDEICPDGKGIAIHGSRYFPH